MVGHADPLQRALHGNDWVPDPAEAHANGHSPFVRMDLAAGLAQARPRPRTLLNLIYPGKLHVVSGEPEAGKTVFCLWLLLAVINLDRPVLLLDQETGPGQVSDLLRAMGADLAAVAKHLHYYPFPTVSWTDADIASLHKLMAEISPVLSVFDSTTTMLTDGGLDENKPADVTRFWKRVLGPLGRQFGCAVLATDHDSKGGFDSRYARGSTAKLAAIDVMLKLAAVEPFSRDTDGWLNLEVTKDRLGCLHRHWRVDVTRDPLTLAFAASAGKPAQAKGGAMAPGKKALAGALGEAPMDISKLVDIIVARGGTPMRRETCWRYLAELEAEGAAERISQGEGRAVLWCKPQPPPEPGAEQGKLGW